MCGLVGLILGRKQRRLMERVHLCWLFSRLLELNEPRGPHATGAAWVNRDGEHALIKQPAQASWFLRQEEYPDFIDEVDNRVTVLMGHTRWRTRGCERNNRNNHPILASNRRGEHPSTVVGSHNGTIYNAEWLATRFRMRMQTDVDSEVLVRTMASCWGPDGFDAARFRTRLLHFEGQISAAFACKEDPTRVVVIKGNKPLAFRYHKKARGILYSSLEEHLDAAIGDQKGWHPLDVGRMIMLVFDTEALEDFESHPIRFRDVRRDPARQEEEAP